MLKDLLKKKEKTEEELEFDREVKKIELEERRIQAKQTAREKIKIEGELKRKKMREKLKPKKNKRTEIKRETPFEDIMNI